MIGLTLFDAMTTRGELSNGFHPGDYAGNFIVALSDDNDIDAADNRVLTGWRVLNLSLSRLSAVFAVATGVRMTTKMYFC